MATLRELIIKISANSQSFQSEIQRASRMGSEYYRTLQNGGRQAAAAAREQRRALAELHSQLTENPRFGCRNDRCVCRCLCHRTPDFAGG
ncbi:phage tail tape measure protein [Escherichia coli]|nr:phage tail tape measure protein [Escherichia coli]